MDAGEVLDFLIDKADKELRQMRNEQAEIWELKQQMWSITSRLRKLGCKKIVINGKFIDL